MSEMYTPMEILKAYWGLIGPTDLEVVMLNIAEVEALRVRLAWYEKGDNK